MNPTTSSVTTALVAVLSVLIFEGTRRVITTRGVRAGLPSYFLGLLVLAALAFIEFATYSVAKESAAIFRLEQWPANGYAIVTDPKAAMPNMPLPERAALTRNLATWYYLDTGRLGKHISMQGEVVSYSPTQGEILQRERDLTMKVSAEIQLAHTTEKHIELLSIILISVFAAFIAARSDRKVSS